MQSLQGVETLNEVRDEGCHAPYASHRFQSLGNLGNKGEWHGEELKVHLLTLNAFSGSSGLVLVSDST